MAHPTKSQWIPKQEGEHLGFNAKLKKDGDFSLSVRRVLVFTEKNLGRFATGGRSTARMLASLAGTIISIGLALGPVARMQTQSICSVINKASFWDQEVSLPAKALNEIKFWSECLEDFNGQTIWPVDPSIKIIFYSDAPHNAWGGYMVHIYDQVAKGNFSENEMRELKGTISMSLNHMSIS